MISSPNAIGTLTGLQNLLALIGGFGQFSDLHADRQSQWNGWLELAIMEMVSERDWTFEHADSEFAVVAATSTGTVSVNAANTAVTGSGTQFSTDGLANGLSFINFGNESGFYPIPTVTDDTNLVISPSYGGSTNLSGASYEAGTPDIELAADVWMLKEIREIHETGARLPIEDHHTWLKRTRGVWSTGKPTRAVLLGGAGDASGTNFQIRLWPVPDDTYRYAYWYRRAPTWQSGDLREAPQALNMIVFKALQLQALGTQQYDMADKWGQQYVNAVKKAANKDVNRGRNSRRRLDPSWGDTRGIYDLEIIDDPTGTSDA